MIYLCHRLAFHYLMSSSLDSVQISSATNSSNESLSLPYQFCVIKIGDTKPSKFTPIYVFCLLIQKWSCVD